jgi:hypothetical protein
MCGGKIISACKFIDFFVHDVLDYTLLSKDAKNFIKQMQVFNIRDAVKEIVEVLEDKMKMTKIKCKTKFLGFDFGVKDAFNYFIKSDQKRFQ